MAKNVFQGLICSSTSEVWGWWIWEGAEANCSYDIAWKQHKLLHSSAHPPEPSHLLVLNSNVVLIQYPCYIQCAPMCIDNRTTVAINMTAPCETVILSGNVINFSASLRETTYFPAFQAICAICVVIVLLDQSLDRSGFKSCPLCDSPFQKFAPLHQGAALHVAWQKSDKYNTIIVKYCEILWNIVKYCEAKLKLPDSSGCTSGFCQKDVRP